MDTERFIPDIANLGVRRSILQKGLRDLFDLSLQTIVG
jgi:hypothetical protein